MALRVCLGLEESPRDAGSGAVAWLGWALVKGIALTAPDTHPRMPGRAVLTTDGSALGASGASAHGERQAHKCELVQGICLRTCHKFLLQGSWDNLFFLTRA